MKRLVLSLLAAPLLAAPLMTPVQGAPTAAPVSHTEAHLPNTVVVMVDDGRNDDTRVMPNVRTWLQDEGVRFSNAVANTPLCCPARATFLTGQYAHNTNVYDNKDGHVAPGSVTEFRDNEDETIATALPDEVVSGYVGKYLNGYTGNYVPAGWDDWRAGVQDVYAYKTAGGETRTGERLQAYEGTTTYNINGSQQTIQGYEADVTTDMAWRFINRNADKPFYLQVNYLAPHGNLGPGGAAPIPEDKYADRFTGYQVPRGGSFNEADMSDKPPINRPDLLTADEIDKNDHWAGRRLASLLSVDDGLARIKQQLADEGILGNTNIIFVSDNGFLLGEHRVKNTKVWHFRESLQVPLIFWGPNTANGIKRDVPVGLHDVAPTILKWYGASLPNADGIPITGTLPERDVLVQGTFEFDAEKSYVGLLSPSGWRYFRFNRPGYVGPGELYNGNTDVEELNSLYAPGSNVVAQLDPRLRQLMTCSGATCL